MAPFLVESGRRDEMDRDGMDRRGESMKVVSVNVSGVREVADGDKQVTTGIFKEPVAGPIELRELNLTGDDQADRVNHGGEHKAVYAYGLQHLSVWAERFPEIELAPGIVGENLSVDYLDEAALRVGDRLRVGKCLLEISQPRVPCFKLGLKTGLRSFPREFVRGGRTGVYLRVIETGSLQAGDDVTIEERGTGDYTLDDLFAAVYDLGGQGRRVVLDDALANPALSDEWREVVKGKLARLDGG